MEGVDSKYIRRCLYNPVTDPLCPIFRLGDIVNLSGFNFPTIAKVVSWQRYFSMDAHPIPNQGSYCLCSLLLMLTVCMCVCGGGL